MRISAAIKSILYGVSTDDKRLRNKLYLEEQVNMQTVDGSGLHKRPPAELVDPWSFPLYTDDETYYSILKSFEVSGQLHYMVIRGEKADLFANKLVSIYEQDGTEITLVTPTTSYFHGARYASDIHIATQQDTVFITNRTLETEMLPDLRITENTSLIHVLRAPLDASVLTWTFKDTAGTSYTQNLTVGTSGGKGTNVVAAQIASLINSATPVGLTAQSRGSVIAFVRTDAALAEVSVEDQDGGAALVAINGKLKDINDLPRYLPGTQILKVQPETDSERGIFYMRSEVDGTASVPVPPVKDIEFTAGEQYPTVPNARGTGVSSMASCSGINVGTWLTKASLGGVQIESVIFYRNYNGTGARLQITPCGGASVPGFPSGSLGRFTIRRSSDDVVIFDQSVFTSDEFPWGTGVAYAIPVSPTVILNIGTNYKGYINKTSTLSSNLVQVNWVESSAAGQQYLLNPDTMPHIMQRAGANMQMNPGEWDERDAGDDDTNPIPSFIGKPIRALGTFQNRLVAVEDDRITTTETDNTRSWFRNTVTQLLATHPVSIRSTSPDSDAFHNVLNHNRDFLLFSDKSQFKLAGDYPLTPATAGLPQTGSYKNNPDIPPVSIGRSVYFSFPYGNYNGIAKYQTGSEKERQDRADPITDHIKKYMPGTPHKLLGDANLGIIYAVHDDAIYVCDYEPKPTNAEFKRYGWSKWFDLHGESTATILDAALIENKLQLTLYNPVLERCSLVALDIIQEPTADTKRVYLDFLIELTADASGDLAVPWWYPMDSTMRVIYGENTDLYGASADFIRTGDGGTSDVISITSEVQEGWTFQIGYPFESYIIPSPLYIRDEGGHVNPYTRLNIVKYLAHLTDSADVSADLISDYYNTPPQYWSGLISNDIYSQTDKVSENSASFDIGVGMQSDLHRVKIHSSGHLPMNITGIDFLGTYSSRGRRF